MFFSDLTVNLPDKCKKWSIFFEKKKIAVIIAIGIIRAVIFG